MPVKQVIPVTSDYTMVARQREVEIRAGSIPVDGTSLASVLLKELERSGS